MKCTTPEISWHNRYPVLSVDIQSGLNETSKGDVFWRLATGGADFHVLIWHLTTTECGKATVNCVADLERHQKAVNVVRFSPSKEILASGDDESAIILWKLKDGHDSSIFMDHIGNKEQWVSLKVLRGHLEDIYDISWSPDSNFLISGSVDNTAIIWNIQKGQRIAILSDHKGFVQGVSWDPCNQYLCTISTDRYCRLIDIATRKVIQRVHKSKIPVPPGHPLEGKVVRLFHDDTFQSFFRRLTFSIDGLLIFVSSGIIESQEIIDNAVMVFSRENIKEPIMVIPTIKECTIAIRCCPLYFELRKDGPVSMIALPYRMIIAIATQHSVLFYDTQQTTPFAAITNIHYARLNDISWSTDGRILIVSSTDGYCSIIHFKEGELGEIYKAKNPASPQKETIPTLLKESLDNTNKENITAKNNTTTFDVDDSAMDIDLMKCSMTTTVNNQSEEHNIPELHKNKDAEVKNRSHEDIAEDTEDIKLVYNDESNSNIASKSKNNPLKDVSPIMCGKIPRRVKLITLSSPKASKK